MWPVLEQKLARFRELETMMENPAIASDPHRSAAVGKEHGSLRKLVLPYQQFLDLDEQIRAAEQMAADKADPEMQAMAEEELAGLRPRREELKLKIEDQLLVDPSEDFDRLILEIRAGTGGDEAALFAGELFEMYSRYARTHGWAVEEINHSPGDAGGFKDLVASVRGEGVFQALRFESGGHRVQRVPKTETQGRIHTSLATVGVMPEPDEVNVEINPADLEIEVMRAGGAGGQHVNKTESAVRIWYRKGTADEQEVKCQDGRSQTKNKEQAMRVLRSRVYEAQQRKLHQARSDMRRTLIGGGDRGERIRTYNFADGRVTDHRIGLTVYKLQDILGGMLDHLVIPMQAHDKQERLAAAASGK
jgi:peptide chain release factor 1